MKSPRIVGALFVGIALVGLSFFVRSTKATGTQDASIILADAPRTYIRTGDTDGDGMRDWEEGLYGTDPLQPNEAPVLTPQSDTTTKDTEIPDTMTARFALDFFGKYFQAGGGESLDAETKEALLKDASAYAMLEGADRPFNQNDVIVRGEDSVADVRAYGNTLAEVLTRHTLADAETELMILERALITDDESALTKLVPIRESYQKTLADVLAMSVPPAFAASHLELANALLGLHNDIAAMEHSFKDALPAMVRFQRYPGDVERLRSALLSISARLRAYDATYARTEAGNLWNTLVQP